MTRYKPDMTNPGNWTNLCAEHGWQVSNGRLLEALGFRRGQHLPEEGMPIRAVGNVRVRILPREEGRSRKAHRTQAECPKCGDWFCAGHLHQHMKACEGTCDGFVPVEAMPDVDDVPEVTTPSVCAWSDVGGACVMPDHCRCWEGQDLAETKNKEYKL